jgi:hypothetical protein
MVNPKSQHLEKAASKINEKPSAEIDFTQHQLEDGEWISTQERVIKDVRRFALILLNNQCILMDYPLGASSSNAYADRRAVLVIH